MFYKKLNIHDFQEIQNKIVSYVINFVEKDLNQFEKKHSEKTVFKFIPDEDLKKIKEDIPDLFDCVQRELGSEVVYMSFVCIDNSDSMPIHTDGEDSIKRRIRLHWPILNEKSAATIFYEKNNKEVTSKLRLYKSGVYGQVYDLDDVHEVDRYVLDVPTLNNVKEIHGIEILNQKLPRILLTMRLSNEEEVYQKYFN
jgi:hypothetical protein